MVLFLFFFGVNKFDPKSKETIYAKDDTRNHSGTEEGDLTFTSAFQISFVVKALMTLIKRGIIAIPMMTIKMV